jgi:pantoate--beta-alanine ligase
MTEDFPIVSGVCELRQSVAAFRKAGMRVGLVPTMGALHDGHLSLLHEAKKRADRVIVSIFVNPTQFAPNEDYDSYPRTLNADADKIAETGAADLIFAPSAREMYPTNFATGILVGGPARGLESDHRPHFFAGVAVIVAKLLIAATPDVAVFGEKDYQQLLVVRRLTADLGLPVEIVGAPILRDADGLAMSSRNVYLSQAEHAVAVRMNAVLKQTGDSLRRGTAIVEAEADGKRALLDAGFQSVDYVAVRDAATLGALETLDRPARLLAAAKIGRTRLIDNMAV